MDDTQAVAQVIESLEEGERIGHATARTIGSWFNDGADTVIYAFVSTGAMPTDTDTPCVDLLHALMRGVDEQTRSKNTDALLALDYYLEDREAAGDLGPGPGWSGMWVR